MEGCAAPRPGQDGTWITDEMTEAYVRLFELGHAHSVEAWEDDRLVGGLYGVSVGRMFFGESMFSRVPDASKVALVRSSDKSNDGASRAWTARCPRAICRRSALAKFREPRFCGTSGRSCGRLGRALASMDVRCWILLATNREQWLGSYESCGRVD